MKTVREWAAVRRQESEVDLVERQTAFRALLDSLSDIPCYPVPAAMAIRDDARRVLALHADDACVSLCRIRLLNLACDHCGTRLIDIAIHQVCTSSPPCFRAVCPGCGWDTFLPLDARSSS